MPLNPPSVSTSASLHRSASYSNLASQQASSQLEKTGVATLEPGGTLYFDPHKRAYPEKTKEEKAKFRAKFEDNTVGLHASENPEAWSSERQVRREATTDRRKYTRQMWIATSAKSLDTALSNPDTRVSSEVPLNANVMKYRDKDGGLINRDVMVSQYTELRGRLATELRKVLYNANVNIVVVAANKNELELALGASKEKPYFSAEKDCFYTSSVRPEGLYHTQARLVEENKEINAGGGDSLIADINEVDIQKYSGASNKSDTPEGCRKLFHILLKNLSNTRNDGIPSAEQVLALDDYMDELKPKNPETRNSFLFQDPYGNKLGPLLAAATTLVHIGKTRKLDDEDVMRIAIRTVEQRSCQAFKSNAYLDMLLDIPPLMNKRLEEKEAAKRAALLSPSSYQMMRRSTSFNELPT